MKSTLTPQIALELLQNARDKQKALELFSWASTMRDETLGKQLWWTSGSGGIFPCRVKPRCSYCSFFTDDMLPMDGLLRGLEIIENMGIRQFHISGGTDLDGSYVVPLLEMVQQIRARSSLSLEVNLGPSFSKETVIEMQKLGVESVTSSLECNNSDIFRQAKPGDSLQRRQLLLKTCDEIGMPSRTMMLVGLGETDRDRIEHLFYLKQFQSLYQIRVSRFMPFPGTPYENMPRCSPWETALVIAMARLILPDLEISLAAGNSADDIPLWYLAGGGNQLMGASITRKAPKTLPGVKVHELGNGAYVVDQRGQTERILDAMRLEITCEMPPPKGASIKERGYE